MLNEKFMYKGQELLPVTSDIVFKSIFGQNDSKDLLASLLNSFLDINIQSPEQIEYVGTELIKTHKEDKLDRLDVRVKIDESTHIDIEIQVRDEKDMIPRSLYYLSCLYTEQMTEGMQYKDIGKTIALNILCFNLFEEDDDYINRFRFMNINKPYELTDLLEVEFVELKKYLKLRDHLYNPWASFLSVDSQEELDMLAESNEDIKKAAEKLKYVSSDEEIRYIHDMRRKARLDEASRLAHAREEGIISVAKNLLDILDDKTIAEKTGLSVDEVKKLRTLPK